MTAFSIINETLKNSFVFASKRDIYCNIFQNITRVKTVLIHEKKPDIITDK